MMDYLGGGAALATFIFFLFQAAHLAMNEEGRKAFGRWVVNSDSNTMWYTLGQQFRVVFESVFGREHGTLFCFKRSVAASFLSFIFCYFILSVLVFDGAILENFTWTVLLLPLVLNFIPDNISLWQTRYFINYLSNRTSLLRIVAILVVDSALTLLIVYVAFAILYFFDSPVNPGGLYTPIRFIDQFIVEPNLFTLAVLVTSFLTSVWLWVFIIGVTLSLILKRINGVWKKVTNLKWIDFDNNALHAVGLIAMFATIIIYSVVYCVWVT